MSGRPRPNMGRHRIVVPVNGRETLFRAPIAAQHRTPPERFTWCEPAGDAAPVTSGARKSSSSACAVARATEVFAHATRPDDAHEPMRADQLRQQIDGLILAHHAIEARGQFVYRQHVGRRFSLG